MSIEVLNVKLTVKKSIMLSCFDMLGTISDIIAGEGHLKINCRTNMFCMVTPHSEQYVPVNVPAVVCKIFQY
jgi:hypothetical protein